MKICTCGYSTKNISKNLCAFCGNKLINTNKGEKKEYLININFTENTQRFVNLTEDEKDILSKVFSTFTNNDETSTNKYFIEEI